MFSRVPHTALAAALCASMMLPANAQGSLRVGVQNMRLAMDLCLHNYRTPQVLAASFSTAGFSTSERANESITEFTAPGMSGLFAINPPFCSIQSTDVPLAIAEEMGLKLSVNLFGELVELGHPERNIATPVQPCEGLHIFAKQTLIRVTYSAAGNSGECLNDGTSAIAIKM